MNIRKAKKEDLESIHKLDVESTEYHKQFDKDFFTISEEAWKMKAGSQQEAINNPEEIILIAEIDNIVVGYVWGFINIIISDKIGKIQELIVTSTQRGKGIGKELINNILKLFIDRKCVISEIEVFVDNVPTVKVYEKVGFKKREYKMQLKLN